MLKENKKPIKYKKKIKIKKKMNEKYKHLFTHEKKDENSENDYLNIKSEKFIEEIKKVDPQKYKTVIENSDTEDEEFEKYVKSYKK